jgi:hypothetical protein
MKYCLCASDIKEQQGTPSSNVEPINLASGADEGKNATEEEEEESVHDEEIATSETAEER